MSPRLRPEWVAPRTCRRKVEQIVERRCLKSPSFFKCGICSGNCGCMFSDKDDGNTVRKTHAGNFFRLRMRTVRAKQVIDINVLRTLHQLHQWLLMSFILFDCRLFLFLLDRWWSGIKNCKSVTPHVLVLQKRSTCPLNRHFLRFFNATCPLAVRNVKHITDSFALAGTNDKNPP